MSGDQTKDQLPDGNELQRFDSLDAVQAHLREGGDLSEC